VTIGPASSIGLQHVHHASDQRLADRHLHDAPGALHHVAFANRLEVAEQHGADFVLFEVQREAANVMRKLEQFAGHDLFQTVNLGDAVADLDNGSDFGDGAVVIEVFDLLTNNLVDFASSYRFHDFL